MRIVHIQLIFIQQIVIKNTNYSSTVPYANCMYSVAKPWNHSYTTTNYQSLRTTTDNKGIHNKLQFLNQILNIPVAFINNILPATLNKTFLENGYNRMKTLS